MLSFTSYKVQCNRVTKKKNPHIALSKFTVLHWAALKAMWPEGQRARGLDIPEGYGQSLERYAEAPGVREG